MDKFAVAKIVGRIDGLSAGWESLAEGCYGWEPPDFDRELQKGLRPEALWRYLGLPPGNDVSDQDRADALMHYRVEAQVGWADACKQTHLSVKEVDPLPF